MHGIPLNSVPYEVICYPSGDRKCFERRVNALLAAGVKSLLPSARYSLGGAGIIGKGHSSVVIKALLSNGEVVAVKLLRTDSKRESLRDECLALMKSYPISPKVYFCSDEFIVMEFIEGRELRHYIKELRGCNELVTLGIKILGAARYLDIAGVDHKELSIPVKHVIVSDRGTIRIVDFESVSIGRACNVNRISSWFLVRSGITRSCCQNHGELIKHARGILREYKHGLRDESFARLIKLIVKHCLKL